ncbi:hypothetical protein M5D96_007318, partial [Drosophila gunungcola]
HIQLSINHLIVIQIIKNLAVLNFKPETALLIDQIIINTKNNRTHSISRLTHTAFGRFPATLTKSSILYQFDQFSHLNEMQIQFPEQRNRRTGGKLNG